MSLLINPRDMDFVLYELLDAEHLTQSDIYADLDRDTFNAVIDTAKKLAEDKFEPFAAKLDANEPTFDGNGRFTPQASDRSRCGDQKYI